MREERRAVAKRLRWIGGGASLLTIMAVCFVLAPSALAAAPTVSAVAGSEFSDSGLTLSGTIDPGGESTKYRFEYVSNEAFLFEGFAAAASSPAPSGVVPGEGVVAVSTHLSGLLPGTSYHVRLVAANGAGTVAGIEAVYGTYAASTSGLPDDRAYEQASPTDKAGLNVNGRPGLVQAAADGNAISYYVEAGLPGSEGAQEFPNYLAIRSGDEWLTQNLLPPASTGPNGRVLGWSEDQSASFVQNKVSSTEPTIVYMRDNSSRAMQEVERWNANPNGLALAGISAGTQVVAFEAKGPPASAAGVSAKPNVYVWNRDAGTFRFASVMNSELPPNFEGAMAGPYQWWGSASLTTGGALASFYTEAEHVLSSDGDSLFFTSGGDGQIYLRQHPTQPQSSLVNGVSIAHGAAKGTGTLTAGSNTVTSLVSVTAKGTLTTGSPVVTKVKPSSGTFEVGQAVTPLAGKIASGTTIVAINEVKLGEYTLTLSTNALGSGNNQVISTPGPSPFAIGQEVSGVGIPLGTTITAVSEGSLTLSSNATESGTNRLLTASTDCTEAGKACTLQVSGSESTTPDPNGPKPAIFIGATADGSKAFFMSSSSLTADATTGPTDAGMDLYRYEAGKPAHHRLTDLAPEPGAANGSNVKGVLGFNADGSYVYFAAAAALAGTGAPPSTCAGTGQSVSGTCNVYVWHEDSQGHESVRFVAQVEVSAGFIGDNMNWSPSAAGNAGNATIPTARVSANGDLLFASSRSLTGYANVGDSCHALGGTLHGPGPCSELYRYTPDGAAPLTCVSCDPTGAAPAEAASLISIFALSGPSGPASTISRNMSADGRRIFFESPDRLVSSDVNGVAGCPLVNVPGGDEEVGSCQDVYEWVAPGTGACQVGRPAYSEANGGCLYLLSTGADGEPSFFADNDESGDNAFFFTFQQLVGQDKDRLLDIYDARVGGGLASQNPAIPTICLGSDSCRGPVPSAPAVSSPQTEAFVGPSNRSTKPKRHRKAKHRNRKHHHRKHSNRRGKSHRDGRAEGKLRAGAWGLPVARTAHR